jgi:hypothetical protein
MPNRTPTHRAPHHPQELPQGFKVSPTQHSCTRGLWMWSVPIPMKDADGRPCNLVSCPPRGGDGVWGKGLVIARAC